MKWMGRGPYRVWKNRIPGTNYGVWHKEYNNTITGESFENLVYPEFKGYIPFGEFGHGVFYASFRFFGSEHMEEDTVIP